MLILLEQLNLLFSGFCGTHRPNAPPSHGTADNVPDLHDEADFDIPDTQSVLETFMSKLLETFSHPMLQFLPQKLAEWIANSYAEELNAPLRPNIQIFQTVEFKSDLYHGVMCARCYPFNMERHRLWGRNVKVCTYTWYMLCI